MASKRRLAGVSFGALLSFAAGSGCQPAPTTNADDTTAYTSDKLNSNGEETAAASADWSKFGNGQCLVAVQNFYPAKFGVSVPVAGSGTGSCASAGACLIWLSNQPSAMTWERIPYGGGAMPSMYDLIVYPPTSGNPYGHIASVDHVENGKVFVMDANHVPAGGEQKAPAVHTINRTPYGWYHLRSLTKSPAPQPKEPPAPTSPTPPSPDGTTVGTTEPCFPNGDYCGGDKVAGDPNSLYTCNSDGTTATLVQACANGCAVNLGSNDSCN
jgi:hypothetical protein